LNVVGDMEGKDVDGALEGRLEGRIVDGSGVGLVEGTRNQGDSEGADTLGVGDNVSARVVGMVEENTDVGLAEGLAEGVRRERRNSA
jgi:hypothetical protein